MRQVQIKNKRGDVFQVVVQRTDMFNLVWALQNSPTISQFMVYDCGVKETHKDYHFAQMDKWVTEFTFNED